MHNSQNFHRTEVRKRVTGFDSFYPVALAVAGLLAIAAGILIYAITLIPDFRVMILVWGGVLFELMLAFIYRKRLADLLRQRRFLEMANIKVFAAICFAILFLVNLLSSHVRMRIDTTATGEWTLSSSTMHLLDMIDEPVKIFTFFDSEDPAGRYAVDLVDEYSFRQPLISAEHYISEEATAMAQIHDVEMRTILVMAGDRRIRVFDPVESRISAALMRVLRHDVKTVLFVTGHGEPGIDNYRPRGLSETARQLRETGYRVSEVVLSRLEQIPAETDALVLMGPRSDFTSHESAILRDYLRAGGSALLAFDPESIAPLEWIERDYGVLFKEGIIVDSGSHLLKDITTPLVNRFFSHPVTEGINQAFFPGCRAVKLTRARPGYEYRPLANSSLNSFLKRHVHGHDFSFEPGVDVRGPHSTGMLLWKLDDSLEGASRLALLGDSDFPLNRFQDSPGNRQLMISLLAWLADDTEALHIRDRAFSVDTAQVDLPNFVIKSIFFSTTTVVPGLLLVAGLIVWLRNS